ncbi:MAG: efflux RND transporter periplasmic adaptor subunit [Phenylobacterium sp.]|uniref:efflux RND transporter periplasmic adaptor subunit n=1 Tax=Phenylobacterium sp. TaxID=1871053 RepID=UPI00120E9A95|nr:efflux RND transporter periplasmic adaptor subunit [Phenylobacterium sp.]TAJ68796.1 MAG: efflux RND transporter periplasmic adaptor subunit [Phenylobacterium sp.]
MTRRQTLILSAVGLAAAVALGFGLGRVTDDPAGGRASTAQADRKVLYWYDPMVPAQHFDKPGKSPFMDMQLQPKYADTAPTGGGLQIDPARVQALGLRTATVTRGTLPSDITATGVIDFNERDFAVVQARAAGFVQRVHGRAPGDMVRAGAPLADLLVPEWAGAQGEFLAVRRTGDPALTQAARQRLQLLGMSAALIESVARSGQVRNVVTVTTPSAGVIKTLAVRNGMTVAAGQTLAEINGLSRVWLNAAVPEALAGQVGSGEAVSATLAAYPGETFSGRVSAVLPEAQAESRTLTVRVELPNPGGRLRPGMFAKVQFGGRPQPALLVPSEAVIRTGRRTLVMLALSGGRYEPAEIRPGREAGGWTEVLAGLSDGETVVASGQFLLDSEASLSGVPARPLAPRGPVAAAPTLYESVGRIEQIADGAITLSHEPVPAIQWPAMTMTFRLADPALARGLSSGQQVRFAFEQTPGGPLVRRIRPAAAR